MKPLARAMNKCPYPGAPKVARSARTSRGEQIGAAELTGQLRFRRAPLSSPSLVPLLLSLSPTAQQGAVRCSPHSYLTAHLVVGSLDFLYPRRSILCTERTLFEQEASSHRAPLQDASSSGRKGRFDAARSSRCRLRDSLRLRRAAIERRGALLRANADGLRLGRWNGRCKHA